MDITDTIAKTTTEIIQDTITTAIFTTITMERITISIKIEAITVEGTTITTTSQNGRVCVPKVLHQTQLQPPTAIPTPALTPLCLEIRYCWPT